MTMMARKYIHNRRRRLANLCCIGSNIIHINTRAHPFRKANDVLLDRLDCTRESKNDHQDNDNNEREGQSLLEDLKR